VHVLTLSYMMQDSHPHHIAKFCFSSCAREDPVRVIDGHSRVEQPLLAMYAVNPLSQHQLPAFAGLAFPHMRPRLRASGVTEDLIAVGASVFGSPVGLLVAELQKDKPAEVRSVIVAREYRRMGIATCLFDTLEHELVKRACFSASMAYIGRVQPRPATEGLLRKSGWTLLEARGICCATEFSLISQAPWMRYTQLPEGFDCALWSGLTNEQRSHVAESQRRHPWYPEVLSPFIDGHDIETDTSLALIYSGEVLGWCVFHRVSDGATQCKSLFVRQELQNRGVAIALLVRAIESHRNSQRQTFLFDVSFDKVKMIRFVKRRMLPYLQSVWTISRSSKRFNGEQSRSGVAA
jgi:GNAT superfamily N-acetyltransferase